VGRIPALRPIVPHVDDQLLRRLTAKAISDGAGVESWLTHAWLSWTKRYHVTYYTTRNHTPIVGATRLQRRDVTGPSAQFLLMTDPENIQRILHDVADRMLLAQSLWKPQDREECFRQFATAMYGYYQAYPYDEGTLDIGRAIFSGYFLGIFRQTLGQYPSDDAVVDYLALSQTGFVDWMVSVLKGNLREAR
jgi:hypothetical protein